MADIQQPVAEIKLRKREDRRVRAGHLWIYSNEIDTQTTPIKELAPGALVTVIDARDQPLGLGYINPHALLCIRLLSRRTDAEFGLQWFERKLRKALDLRDQLFTGTQYRWVFAESDQLPGLVIDRFDQVLAVQITTAGMQAQQALLRQAIDNVLPGIKGIVWRNDAPLRELEGLPSQVEVDGEVPAEVQVEEAGLKFRADLREGQKTGWFFDQVDNRQRLARYAKGRRVLDLYSYAGAWGLRALQQGASAALSVDSSASAVAVAEAAAADNGLALEARKGQALEVMQELNAEAQKFDLVVLDPPALIKRKKDFDAGFSHYVRINRAAMQLLPEDGILVSCSCSHHLSAEQLQQVLMKAARGAGRQLQILEQGAQSVDHPVHPAMPETRYLKVFYCRLTAK